MAGNKNSGDKKAYVKHRFQRILEETNADSRFKKILVQTKDEDRWLKAYEWCYDRAYGKPPQSVEMELNDVTERPSADELDAALRSLNGHSKGNGMAESK